MSIIYYGPHSGPYLAMISLCGKPWLAALRFYKSFCKIIEAMFAMKIYEFCLQDFTIKDLSNLVSATVAFVVIIIGEIWTFWRFRKHRESTQNSSIRLEYRLLPYDASNKLLVTIIKARNIGKVQVRAKKLSFSLKILPYGKNTGTCLNWHDGVSLVEEYNVI